MRIRKSAGIQCIILVLFLTAEFFYTGEVCIKQSEAVQKDDVKKKLVEDSLSEREIDSVQKEEKGKNGLGENNLSGGGGSTATVYISGLGAPEEVVKPAKIVLEKVPAELTDTEFIYGKLHVVLSEESVLESPGNKEDGSFVCLSAEEAPSFLKKMYFTHYKVKWEEPWELIFTAFELSGQDEVRWYSAENGAELGDRVFVAGAKAVDIRENRGGNFYMLVCDEDLYVLEDNGADSFCFWDGSYKWNLRWDDSDQNIEGETEGSVSRLGDQGMDFLLCEGRGHVVFRNGNFKEPVQILEGRIDLFEDINFDGCSDLELYDEKRKERSYFLWDRSKERFVKAVVPEGSYSLFKYRLEDYETIWDWDVERDNDWELSEITERLYRWEGKELKKDPEYLLSVWSG